MEIYKILSKNRVHPVKLPKINHQKYHQHLKNNIILLSRNQSSDNYINNYQETDPNNISTNKMKKIKHNKIISNPDFYIHINISEKTNETSNITLKTIPKNIFLSNNKILSKLFTYFNIRELFIFCNINSYSRECIKYSPIYQKYILIRKEFTNSDDTPLLTRYDKNSNKNINKINEENDLFKHIFQKKLKIKRLKQKKVKYYLNTEKKISVVSNNLNIKNEKYSLFNNRQIGKTNQIVKNIKHLSPIKNLYNFSEENNENEKLKVIDYSKLNILNLLKSDVNKIVKLIKKYNLTFIESQIIFNGLIEHLILKNYSNIQNNVFNLLCGTNAEKYSIYYLDSILNLNYENLLKIELDKVILTSIKIMKKLSIVINRSINTLKILILSNNDIDDNSAKILFDTLYKSNFQQISILNLSNNKITIKGILSSRNFFKSNTSINTLVFSHNLIGSTGCNNLINYLKENENLSLRTIDLSYNGITKDGLTSLIDFIILNNKLVTLNLAGNYLCDEGIKKLSDIYSCSKIQIKLSYLNLENNNITKNSCKYINKIISFSMFITSILLNNNPLYNDGVINILSHIDFDCSLITLDLSCTQINEKCVKYISEKFDKFISIRILNLSINDLSSACIYIKNLLIKETNLKSLKLNSCNIKDKDMLIFEGLSKNKNIETFDLSKNNLSILNIYNNHLISFFKDNHVLKNLILDDTKLNDGFLLNFSKGILINSNLKKISILSNDFSDKYINELIDSIKKNNAIKKLEIDGNNNIDKKYLVEIKSILENKSK